MKLSDVFALIDDPEGCTFTYQGHKVRYLDDAGTIDRDSRFYVVQNEFGPWYLVHVTAYSGDGYESAWEAWLDEQPTIDPSELVEAYQINGESFDDIARKELADSQPQSPYWEQDWDAWRDKVRARAKELLQRADDDARNGHGEYPELVEGYQYQSNSTGTGIVNVGHYVGMYEADVREIEVTPREDGAK